MTQQSDVPAAQPITPVAQTPPAPVAAPPLQPLPEKPKPSGMPKNILTIAMALTILILVLVVVFMMRTKTAPTSQPAARVTPTVIVTPTPAKPLSKIATTEAFATFAAENASFSATLDAFALQDSTLSPPTFDIELIINQ